MSNEQARALARRITEEIFNQGKLNVIDEVFAPGFIDNPPLQGYSQDAAGFKQWVADLRKAFPDFRYTIDDVFGEGDKFVVRLTAQGTFRSQFMGMAPTGKHATWTEMHIVHVSGGKCVEGWAAVDRLGMLQQLGIIPVQQPVAG